MNHVLQVEARVIGTTASVSVTGEVDLASVATVERRVAEVLRDRPETLVLDLTDVGFIDSTGIRLLVDTSRHAVARQVRLVVIRPSGAARRPLDLCKLDDLVSFADGPTAPTQTSPVAIVAESPA